MEPVTAAATSPFWGPVGGAFLGGLFGMFGQSSANSMNRDLSHEQMEFQKWMSNTAHQRAVNDLRAAGLNPILAAGNAASTPQGSMPVMENTMQSMSSAAQQISQMKLQFDKQKEEIALLKSQKNKTDIEALLTSKSIPENSAKATYWEAVDKYLRSRPNTQKEILKLDKKFKSNRTNPLE